MQDVSSEPAEVPDEQIEQQLPVAEAIPSNTVISEELLKDKEEEARIQSFIRSEIVLSASDEQNQTK